MSVMISKDNKELIMTCDCGCDEACHVKITDFGDDDTFAYMTYMNSNFYKEQEHSGRIKAKKSGESSEEKTITMPRSSSKEKTGKHSGNGSISSRYR